MSPSPEGSRLPPPGVSMSQSQGSPLPRVPTDRSRVRLRHRLLFLLLFLLGPSAQRHLPQLRGPGSRAWGAQGDQDLRAAAAPAPGSAPGVGVSAMSSQPPGAHLRSPRGVWVLPAAAAAAAAGGAAGREAKKQQRAHLGAQNTPRGSQRPLRLLESPSTAKPPRTGTRSPPCQAVSPRGRDPPARDTPQPPKRVAEGTTGDTSSVPHPQHPVNHPAGQGVWGSPERSGDKGRDKGPGSGRTPRG